MKADQPDQTDHVRSGVSRRQLFSSGTIMLLGLSSIARANQAGGAPGARRAATHPTAAASPGDASGPQPRPMNAPPIEVGAPSGQPRMAPQFYVDDAGPQSIALTLDDGPHPVYTPQVLDVLDRYGIQATFNMIGRQIAGNLPLVREVAAAGHTITNHTWDHADMRGYPASQVISEIDRCNDALADAGQTPTIFRAPYGYWTPAVFQACATRDLTPLGWSVDPRDWDTAHVTTQDIVTTVLRHTHRHDIILEHDGGGNRSNTVAALRIFIPALLERGFVFAAV
ncbi:polysaccharide deacetylase family protein [Actinospica sp. MGRD01-02]|uniref:Polysaccharide deacetylase family protein n=1 Tax=Actinospica acidithermotolerans TaxID=2828514 RepID=A0A941IKK9_9ACTN|nr:polysaccharide deacetylase family protein [Actinospica acidithermotolerans]MBR7830714.1 polysaccharide deacetylase family protein [Actinospica acidithermotolerans]